MSGIENKTKEVGFTGLDFAKGMIIGGIYEGILGEEVKVASEALTMNFSEGIFGSIGYYTGSRLNNVNNTESLCRSTAFLCGVCAGSLLVSSGRYYFKL